MRTLLLSLLLTLPCMGQGALSVDVQPARILSSDLQLTPFGNQLLITGDGELSVEPAKILSLTATADAKVGATFVTANFDPIADQFEYEVIDQLEPPQKIHRWLITRPGVTIYALVVDGMPRLGKVTVEEPKPPEPPKPELIESVRSTSETAARKVGDKLTTTILIEKLQAALASVETETDVVKIRGAENDAVGDAMDDPRRDPRTQKEWFRDWREPTVAHIDSLELSTADEYRLAIKSEIVGLQDSLLGAL